MAFTEAVESNPYRKSVGDTSDEDDQPDVQVGPVKQKKKRKPKKKKKVCCETETYEPSHQF
jgi:hypothetical protein